MSYQFSNMISKFIKYNTKKFIDKNKGKTSGCELSEKGKEITKLIKNSELSNTEFRRDIAKIMSALLGEGIYYDDYRGDGLDYVPGAAIAILSDPDNNFSEGSIYIVCQNQIYGFDESGMEHGRLPLNPNCVRAATDTEIDKFLSSIREAKLEEKFPTILQVSDMIDSENEPVKADCNGRHIDLDD